MTTGARRILANTGYRLLADAGSKLASIAFYVVMARELGAKGFGVFTFGLAFVLLATTLANFGQDSVLTREVARDKSLLDAYFANTLALKTVLCIGSLAIGIGLAAAFGIDAQTRDVLLLLGPAVSLELLMTTCFATFQAYERMEFTPIALITQRTLTALVGIAALLAGANVVVVAAIYLVGSLIGFTLALQLLLRKVARPRLQIEPRRWWPLLRAAAAIGLTTVFAVVLFRVDMTMLAVFKSKEVVGQYAAAYRLLEATLFISWSVSAAVYPVFSRLTPTSSPPVGFVFDRGIKLGVALTLPLAAGALVLADPLIRTVYGDDYTDAITPLRLLTPAIALYPISYVAASLLVSQHRQRVMLGVYAALATENVLLNLVLIPWLSLDGAALGTSISTVLLAGALVFFTQRTTGRVDWGRVAAGPVLATLAASGAMVLLRGSFAAAIVAGAAVYLAVLFLAERAMYPDDARAVLDLLPTRRATA
jgi:O-antigen/teichoic acid export membrane protein